MKKFMMYFLILVLIALLLLPPGLRIFGKNLYSDKTEKKKDEVYVLNCTKSDTAVNLSYLNDAPYNFQYIAKGDYVNIPESGEIIYDRIMNDIMYYSEINYNEQDNQTEYRIAFNNLNPVPPELENYSMKYEEQSAYYTENGFSCTKVSY